MKKGVDSLYFEGILSYNNDDDPHIFLYNCGHVANILYKGTYIMSYSGLFNDNNPSGYSLLVNKAPSRNRIKHMMNKPGFRTIKELLDTLIGATAGSTASKSYARIKDEVGAVGGGLRTIETVEEINRATTAADVTALKEFTSAVPANTTFVADLSGNGGGASS